MNKKMFSTLFLKRITFFVLCALSSLGYAQKDAVQTAAYNRGIELLEQGRYLEAAEFLSEYPELFLERAQESDDALYIVGVIAERNNELETAFRIYDVLAQKGYFAAQQAMENMILRNEDQIIEKLDN